MGAASEPTKRHLMVMRPVASAARGRSEGVGNGFVEVLTLSKLHAEVVITSTSPRHLDMRASDFICGPHRCVATPYSVCGHLIWGVRPPNM